MRSRRTDLITGGRTSRQVRGVVAAPPVLRSAGLASRQEAKAAPSPQLAGGGQPRDSTSSSPWSRNVATQPSRPHTWGDLEQGEFPPPHAQSVSSKQAPQLKRREWEAPYRRGAGLADADVRRDGYESQDFREHSGTSGSRRPLSSSSGRSMRLPMAVQDRAQRPAVIR